MTPPSAVVRSHHKPKGLMFVLHLRDPGMLFGCQVRLFATGDPNPKTPPKRNAVLLPVLWRSTPLNFYDVHHLHVYPGSMI